MVLDYLPAIIQEGWNRTTERKGTQERPTWSNLGIGSVALRGGSASETGWKPNASWRKSLGQLCKFIQYVCQHSSPTTLKLLHLTNLSLSCNKFYNILTKSSTTLPLHGSKMVQTSSNFVRCCLTPLERDLQPVFWSFRCRVGHRGSK